MMRQEKNLLRLLRKRSQETVRLTLSGGAMNLWALIIGTVSKKNFT